MKKNIFRVFVCVLALAAIACAFAVIANAEVKTGDIYISACGADYKEGGVTAASSYSRNATTYLKAGAFETDADGNFTSTISLNPNNCIIKSADDETDPTKFGYIPSLYDITGRKLEKSGLTYSYDTATKVMTISGKVRKMAGGVDVPWVLPTPGVDAESDNAKPGADYSLIKAVVIEDGTGVTRIYNHCFNNFTACESVTVPKTVKTTECESFGRMSALKTIKISGSEYDTGLDLRNFTKGFDAQTIHTASTKVDNLVIYIGDFLAGKNNTYDASGKLTAKVLQNFGNKDIEKNITVYAPGGQVCDFARDIVMSRGTWTLVDGVYTETVAGGHKYTVTVYPYSPCGVEHLGYRVRTSGYNGLRAEFERVDATAKAYKAADAGQVLSVPEEVEISSGSSKCVEFGVIVGTQANVENLGYELSKNGDEWVTPSSNIKKVAVDPSDSKIYSNNRFVVTVKNFSTKDQMEKKIFYRGYEIWENDNGEQSVAYAEQLAPCSLYDASIGMYRNGLINSSTDVDSVVWDTIDEFKLNIEFTEFTKTALDDKGNPIVYPWSSIAGGELIHNGNSAVKVCVFESTGTNGDSVYTAVARGTGAFNASCRTLNYVRENYLSEAYIGVPIDTFVIDDGITQISGTALSGWSEYLNTSKGADFHTSLTTIILPESLTKIASQLFHSDYKLSNVVWFDADLAKTNPNYVAEHNGIVDISRFDSTQPFDEMFNKGAQIETVILPDQERAIPVRMFMGCSKLTRVYVAGADIPEAGTADLGNWSFQLVADGSGKYMDNTSTTSFFSSALQIQKVVASNGTFNRVGSTAEFMPE